ncbi:MAG TPA: hypothetical protein VNU19_00585 [Candidatus Acidoferrum sp.]|nr:hypothetical protein [Candidatus Acidoferrum sp.]
MNPGSSPVTVTVRSEGITLGDNGTTAFSGRPDPLWAGHTAFPLGDITIPAQHFVDLSVVVHMPTQIDPDLYYIGFLVSPIPTVSGEVVVINQIGAFLTIDVPGPRVRALSADLTTTGFNWGPIHIDALVVGDQVDGRLTVRNIGASSVLFFGENDVTSAPISGPPSQERITRSLLPIGRSRWFAVAAQPAFPIDLVTMTDTVSFPDRTGTGTLQVLRTKTVLVISPWVIVVVCGALALLGGWRLRARLRRRLERRAAARATAHRGRSRAA